MGPKPWSLSLALLALLGLLAAACSSPPMLAPPSLSSAPEPPPLELPENVAFSVAATGGFSPWERVEYSLTWAAGRPVLRHERVYWGGFEDGEPPRSTVLASASWSALIQGLEACGFAEHGSLAPPAVSAGTWLWTLQIWNGDGGEQSPRTTRYLTDEEARESGCIRHLEATVAAETEPIPYVRVFIAESELGKATLTTVPQTDIWIDDVDIGRRTPVFELPLPAGTHRVRFVDVTESVDESFELVIEAGMTTLMELELR